MASDFSNEKVLSIHHWNEHLFSIRTTRDRSFKFNNGQFVMIGLASENKPLLRAYSVVSANYEETLEFLSIKVAQGALTSRLQLLQPFDTLLISKKAVGSLVASDLSPAKNLFLLATGTGIAPFMSIIKDPDVYRDFEKVILVHSVRYISDLAYRNYIVNELPTNDYFGEEIKNKLIYFPTVTREDFNVGKRITALISDGDLCALTGQTSLNPETDKIMICGGAEMIKDILKLIEELGFRGSKHSGDLADYVIERAFVG